MARMDEHPTVKRFYQHAANHAKQIKSHVLDATWLRQICLDAGADDVGFVEVGRSEIADQDDDIFALLPDTKTVVSFLCRMNRENVRSPARSVANLEFHHATDEINEVARRVVAALEQAGIRAVNGGARDFPWRRIDGEQRCG